MHRRTAAAATLAALAGGAALAVAADAQDGSPRTIDFGLRAPAARDFKQLDVKPRGTSPGDRSVGAQTVTLAGHPVGRALLDCVALDASYRGRACTVTLVTREGQLTAQGGGEDRALPGHGGHGRTGDVFAITGGTGGYAGARGTLRVHSGRRGGGTATATLTP
jgi:hypothetical protein